MAEILNLLTNLLRNLPTVLCSAPIYALSNEMLLSSWLDRALAAGCVSSDAYRKISRENAIKILNLN